MKGQQLQTVDKFTYLGSTLSRAVHIDDEVNARIAKASAAFGQLHGSIWDRSGIRLDTKLKVYRLVVLPTLLYACETWTVYQRHAKRLNHFHTSCLRKLLKIKWQDRIPDTEFLKRAGMQSVHTLLKLAQLRWTGHVTRMPDERLPKKILYGELQVGKRSHGGQKKRYKDTLKASLKDFNIPTFMGTDCTGSYKVARPHKKRSWWIWSKKNQRSRAETCTAELRHHQQSFFPQTSLVLSATGSLELRLVSSAILEYTNNNTSHSWLGLVIVSNDRRTITKIPSIIAVAFIVLGKWTWSLGSKLGSMQIYKVGEPWNVGWGQIWILLSELSSLSASLYQNIITVAFYSS